MHKIIAILILLITINNIIIAQEEIVEEEKIVYSEKVTVVAEYEPSISDAFKLKDFPVITDSISTRPILDYSIKARQLPVNFNINPIKAARIVNEALPKLYRGYIKGGFGNYTTPFGELYYNSKRAKKTHYGVYAKHHSSTGNIENYGHPAFSDNKISLFGKSYSITNSWFGKLDYNRNATHFYGYKPKESIAILKNKDILQTISSMSIGVGTKSTYTDTTRLHYDVSFLASTLKDNYNAEENNLGTKINIHQSGKFIKKIPSAQEAGINIKGDYYGSKFIDKKYDHGLVNLSPYFRSWFNNLRISIGLNTYIIADTISKISVNPYIDLRLNLVRDILYIYGGVTGGHERNSFKNLVYENPFMVSNPDLGFTYTKTKAYCGFNGSFSSKMSYNIGMTYSIIDDMPFFVNDTSSSLIGDNTIPISNTNKFQIIHDDVELLNIHAELSYQENEKLRIILKGNLNQYSMTKELKAWHKPTIEAMLSVHYNLQDKIIAKADIIYNNSIYARTFDEAGLPTSIKLNDITDINIGLEYRYTKLISFFLNVNNIGSSRYSRWYNYPNQGINVLGGFSFCF